ncbi:MAG: hypothetical protein RL701_6376 [Pseudomonadota bacterium]|jgi:hypothetical protein
MSIEIRQHVPGKDLHDFMRVPHLLFAGDPVWVPPLDLMVREQLTPGKNPFLDHAEAVLFTAHRDGVPVGRISAQIDREHQKRYADAVGFFGFFDTIDDLEVAQALVHAARIWLGARGIQRMRGPLSFSINEEVGVLVEGFDTPPMVLMGHHTRYQSALIEACGFTKVKDLLAWRYRVEELPPRAQKARAEIAAMSEVKLRIVDRNRFDNELLEMLQIQDDAWRENWAHVSLTAAEGKAVVAALKLLIEPELAIFAEIDGRVAGMAIALPNLNEAARDLDGKLLPLGWAKLLYRLKVQHLKTARLCLLGIKQQYRTQRRYGALALAMVAEIQTRGRKLGVEWGELSWTLEDNAPVNLLIRSVRGQVYKKYRVYELPITAAVG